MLVFCNRFWLVFATSWKIQKRMVFFCICFQKTIFLTKIVCYAQVEAQALIKKEVENVRHFTLTLHQLVEKGWSNEFAATINFNCIEFFTRGFPKKLNGFAQKRQGKHKSSVMEPSIPYPTLVKLIDVEDFTNEKIRILDLRL